MLGLGVVKVVLWWAGLAGSWAMVGCAVGGRGGASVIYAVEWWSGLHGRGRSMIAGWPWLLRFVLLGVLGFVFLRRGDDAICFLILSE